MPLKPISIIVIARNEERNIADCLRTVSWADQIVVVDTGSADRTIEIARTFTEDVFAHPGAGFVQAKRIAVSHCRNKWALWLDADERVPEPLASDIQHAIENAGSNVAFEFPRRAFFLGKWIKHCGWYPGYVTRVFHTDHATFSDNRVHEKLIVNGTTGTLHHDLLHYTDDSLKHYFAKFNDYTSHAADELIEQKFKVRLSDLALRPPLTFLRMYVAKAGFLDGLHGLVLCVLSAGYVFVKYAKTWEKNGETISA